MSRLVLLVMLVSIIPLSFGEAEAAIPRMINYQGVLTDASGTALSGTFQLTFSVYADSSQGATALWSEQHADVSVDGGIFNVILGSIVSIPDGLFATDEYWLGVSVESDPELRPRQRMVSVPYAMRAAVADSAATVGSAVSGAWVISGNDVYSSVSGNAGIGQSSPLSKLHVSVNEQYITSEALEGEDVIIDDSDAVLSLFSGPGGNYGSAINLVEMLSGELNSKWSIFRTAGSLPALRFTCGSDPNYATNPIVMAMLANGNVGIGERNPSRRLVVSDTDVTYLRLTTSNSNGSVLELHNSDSGASTLGRIHFLDSAGDDEASIVYYTDPPLAIDPGLYYYAGGSCRLSISSSDGRIGIGTITPQAMLDVQGSFEAEELKLTGGADIAESFDIGESERAEPGMVVSIDAAGTGKLKVCDRAYDRCVAGIISGAGDLSPGMIMGQEGSVFHGGHPVALTGRVYCLADASTNPIVPGDLLTSSDTAGYAMKVTEYDRARGAVIGKAMSSLKSGQGLVLVLVTLQ